MDDHPVADQALTARLRSILGRIDESDTELVDPPDDLWDGIAESIAAHSAATAQGTPSVVEYCIDADDMVVTHDLGWAAFARQNDAPELLETDSSRQIWSYFADDETRDVWRLLVGRVRDQQRAASVPIRCDAPDTRRWFEMTITPEHGGRVRFRSVLVFEETRDPVPLLTSAHRHHAGSTMVAVCSWCAQVGDGDDWIEIEDLARDRRVLEGRSPDLSFGICPSCREQMSLELAVSDSPSVAPAGE